MNTHTASASALVLAALIERLVTALLPTSATTVTTDGLLRITPLAERAGLRIEGELDYATLPALKRALAALASGDDDFCVDLSSLEFIDVGCLRAFVVTATAIHKGDGDQVLTLRSAPAQMRRLLELTGWHQTPGLDLQASARPG
ncbi:STAS domain-containing protein [Nonomuraea ceibae]|uniref:STAS domain-containing protein n=1 Tax=Nonomuraea ceibae TaxID=1935170 RepID=UPI001C5CC971|nr:STAS domain-containing protein [Nonomuraea ceibae]